MSYLVWLVPIALGMGLVGLLAFMWSMRIGQYEDLDGAAERVLLPDTEDGPLRHGARDSDGSRNEPASDGIARLSETVRKGRTR
ncbi:cbb3-type cytochrome oxidase assembly protein CcoS [Allomesorhizobium alhagi]|uniref:FixS2 nitrogen fixation protein n=1 Tax=Mesorhizobium alhagi CCNWXJ12-2 TaxID=1107882 RepID=H0HZ43_9HYPH|nr:cbb3-type cytochrome oxidase assembly protein CcoS [Mesorhizobium alhagi]EHK53997.1 FixS2 nitrogen fixation protein [Mesorhizobium alhagi CCNWXJ12-2]